MAIALHSVTNNAFQGNNTLFMDASEPSAHEKIAHQASLLEKEAFPGELALLRQQSSQNNQLIDVMPTGLVMLDGSGIVTKVNKVASQLLDEPILGQAWFNVIQRSFKPRADDWHEVSLNDGRRVKLEITTLGDQPGQLIMITDLTQTRLMQDKLSQLQRLSSLGRMVSTLAHQIRTPLSAAMLYSANLTNSKLDEASRSSFQGKLSSRLKDLEQQVNDMLLFSKSGKEQVVTELSVNEVVTESLQKIEALITKADAKVTLKTCDSDCSILGNKHALTGAIQNLIHNSLQVIKNNAEITIQAKCHGAFAYISIEDNGEGIDNALADKIFEPFYTSKTQGTGLGLAVVKSVVEAHQGQVRLLTDQGNGAHFCIKLPLIKPIDKNADKPSSLNEFYQAQNISHTSTQEHNNDH